MDKKDTMLKILDAISNILVNKEVETEDMFNTFRDKTAGGEKDGE